MIASVTDAYVRHSASSLIIHGYAAASVTILAISLSFIYISVMVSLTLIIPSQLSLMQWEISHVGWNFDTNSIKYPS